MLRSLRSHWPEYWMEAAELCLFMISAGLCTTFIQSPVSPINRWLPSAFARRALVGTTMGLTSIAIVYSSWGRQSGAHFNPAITFTFWRLGKVKTQDALFYAAAQFAGGIAGVFIISTLLGGSFQKSPVNYVATRPGPHGLWWALAAESFISFLLMSTVMVVTNRPALAKYTGLFTGLLVALFITFEAPLSGMSMNPARSLSSAIFGQFWQGLWIYFAGPLVGMLAAVHVYRRLLRLPAQACAKIYHANDKRCIFCGHHALIVAFLVCAVTVNAQSSTVAGPIIITVSDLGRSKLFYEDVLAFQLDSERQGQFASFDSLTGLPRTNVHVACLHLGKERIQLIEFVSPKGRKYPTASRSNDLWFQHLAIVVSDMESAYAKLRRFRVQTISNEPQTLPTWNKAAAGIKAFYFRDPDGHPLELICFPPEKGDPRWQRHTGSTFLGVDHTAIAVEDSARSIEFYAALGFHVTGHSLNYGIEQAHLNHVPDSRVRITSLRSADPPGVELLEYLAPRDGRPFPSATRANDLWHDYFMVTLDDLSLLKVKLSGGNVDKAQPLVGSTVKAFVVHDPDGHELLVRAR